MKFKIFILVALFCWSTILGHAAEPKIIANEDVSDQYISQYELIKIFTRKKIFWSDGSKITVFVKPLDSLEHKIFTINILNLTPYKFKSMADAIVYSGSNNPPIEIGSDEEMMLRLANTPNSIGYVNYSIMVNGTHGLISIKIQ